MEKKVRLSKERIEWYKGVIGMVEKWEDSLSRELPMNGAAHYAVIKLTESRFWLQEALKSEKEDPKWANTLYGLKK